MTFALHPVLEADTFRVLRMPVSELLLMNDARFPWCILVPRIGNLTEWHHLPAADRPAVLDEMDRVSRALLALPGISKLNVGALGNRVAQLHIHLIGRHPGDAAWPGPVWGFGTPEPYPEAVSNRLLDELRRASGA